MMNETFTLHEKKLSKFTGTNRADCSLNIFKIADKQHSIIDKY